MNLYAEFHYLIASILRRIAAQGHLPENLDLQRFALEPPRDPAHRDLSSNVAMIYAKEARPHFANPRQLAIEIAAAFYCFCIGTDVELISLYEIIFNRPEATLACDAGPSAPCRRIRRCAKCCRRTG